MDYRIWINKAISKTGSLEKGTVFLLKDLFEGIEWNKLSNGEKRELGRQFKIEVSHKLVPGVIFSGKAENNSSRYQKEV